jgi:ABC-type methionine transport system ATPase subunit
LFGDKSHYKGSWDDQIAKNVEGYPVEYLAPLFSNVEQNKQHELFLNPKQSIFDSILSNQEKARYFKNRPYSRETLQNFLHQGSEKDTDFIKMAGNPATKRIYRSFSPLANVLCGQITGRNIQIIWVNLLKSLRTQEIIILTMLVRACMSQELVIYLGTKK